MGLERLDHPDRHCYPRANQRTLDKWAGREVRGANEIVNDHGAVVDLWLKQRMATLGYWPERVRRAALHEKARS